jgi:hypothetical protein
VFVVDFLASFTLLGLDLLDELGVVWKDISEPSGEGSLHLLVISSIARFRSLGWGMAAIVEVRKGTGGIVRCEFIVSGFLHGDQSCCCCCCRNLNAGQKLS